MKLIYIAGPYGDAGGFLSIDRHIAAAREAAASLVVEGIGYICPHLNSAHFEAVVPEVPVSFWYELDEELLKRADAVAVLFDFEESNGTAREIDLAIERGMPIFYLGPLEDETFSGEWSNLLEWARS